MTALTWSHHATARLRERYQDDTAAAQGRLESLLELGRIAHRKVLEDGKVRVSIDDHGRTITLVISDQRGSLVVVTCWVRMGSKRADCGIPPNGTKANRDRRLARREKAAAGRMERRNAWSADDE